MNSSTSIACPAFKTRPVRRANFPVVFLLLAGLFTGCGGTEYVSVSGRITDGGQPVENMMVVFTPQASEGDHFPGPYSSGVTDSDGNYSLQTRDKYSGAVSGFHSVGLTWADVSPIQLGFLKEQLEIARANGDPESEIARMETRLQSLVAKMKDRPSLGDQRNLVFEVPVSGTDAADFDLSDFHQ